MLEDDLAAVADRIAPPARPDLTAAVLARLDEPEPRRRRRAVVAVGTALVVGLGLSPQVRAFAADLLGVAGIEVGYDEPDASPIPAQPLPSSREAALDRAAAAAGFPLSVPAVLGEPERVRVADAGRVVTMEWRDGTIVLDQFDGTLGPVFSKQVGGAGVVRLEVAGVPGAWIPGPHDLLYVDRDGEVVSATARLAGRTLIWGGQDDVSFRLEGVGLSRREAVAIAGSLAGTS